jgi:hypothetical protein
MKTFQSTRRTALVGASLAALATGGSAAALATDSISAAVYQGCLNLELGAL